MSDYKEIFTGTDENFELHDIKHEWDSMNKGKKMWKYKEITTKN